MDKNLTIQLINTVFSPSAPIEQKDLFFGRIEQIESVYAAILEKGQHAVLYGERGVGKTSLANILYKIMPNTVSVKVTCNRSDNYKGIWAKALSKVKYTISETSVGYIPEVRNNPMQLDLFLPQHDNDITSSNLETIFEKLAVNLLFVFDEFDSITDDAIKAKFADTIKALSDNASHVTVLIVGIGDDVIELIGHHPSLERCLKQIPVPRMSDVELKEIIINGFRKIDIEVNDDVVENIIKFSSGFPHFTHLLSKYTALSTIDANSKTSNIDNFNSAVLNAIKNSQQQIINDFQNAIISSKGISNFENVLYAIAMAKTDEFDSSTANQILFEYNKLTNSNTSREGITYHLGTLCKEERAGILMKVGTSKNIKYKFTSPLMKNFVKLKLYNKKISVN